MSINIPDTKILYDLKNNHAVINFEGSAISLGSALFELINGYCELTKAPFDQVMIRMMAMHEMTSALGIDKLKELFNVAQSQKKTSDDLAVEDSKLDELLKQMFGGKN